MDRRKMREDAAEKALLKYSKKKSKSEGSADDKGDKAYDHKDQTVSSKSKK